MSRKTRQAEYDFIRVTAMLAVVLFHLLGHISAEPYGTKWWVKSCLLLLFSTSNGLYFLLSGKFNLTEKNSSEPLRFYVRRTVTVILPFLICSGICYLTEKYTLGTDGSYVMALIRTFPSTHYWFVYELTGLFFWTPFFARAVKEIRMRDAVILTLGVLTAQGIFVLLKDLGAYPGYELPLMGWPLFYFAGSFADKVPEKWRRRVIVAGSVSLLLSLFQMRVLPDASHGLQDLSPRYFLMVLALYYLLQKIPVTGWRGKAVLAISRNSYYVYLFHNTVITMMFSEVLGFYDLMMPRTGTALYLLLTVFLSITVSCLMGAIIRRLLDLIPVR